MSELITVKTKECCMCHLTSELTLIKTDYLAWQSGMLVQKAFPYLSENEIELLITGIHSKCWDKLFGKD